MHQANGRGGLDKVEGKKERQKSELLGEEDRKYEGLER
jgi:hypothetical protein